MKELLYFILFCIIIGTGINKLSNANPDDDPYWWPKRDEEKYPGNFWLDQLFG